VSLRIEDYALFGDTHTAALVGKDGSIDWLCVPRFDSAAVFAALLGGVDHGRWLLAPAGGIRRVERAYRDDTLVLETTFHTDEGVVRIVDCMPIRKHTVDVVRIVEGVSGRVPIHMDMRVRFDYGTSLPWVRKHDGSTRLVAGANSMWLRTPVQTTGAGLTTVSDFVVGPGDSVPFLLSDDHVALASKAAREHVAVHFVVFNKEDLRLGSIWSRLCRRASAILTQWGRPRGWSPFFCMRSD
jgi:GH15 family glucan-1,4-alpha-glucosidase